MTRASAPRARAAGTFTLLLAAVTLLAAAPTGRSPAPIAQTAGPATRLEVSVPSSVSAGAPVALTVIARDSEGDVASDYRGTVRLTSTDAAATLAPDLTFTEADAGQHTLSPGVTFRTIGEHLVTATDTDSTSIKGSSGRVAVSAPGATRFEVAMPAGVSAGIAAPVTVIARDAGNQVATGYAGTVHFTSTDPAATLPPDYTFTAGDAGLHTFNPGIVFRSTGTRGITVTDTATPGLTGASGPVNVSASDATRLEVTLPAATASGMPVPVQVEARSPQNQLVTSYRGTVHFTSTDPAATLPPDYTFTAVDAGQHTFAPGVTFRTAGPQRLTAVDASAPGVTGLSGTVTVSAPDAVRLEVSVPSSAVAGTPVQVTVVARDAANDVATGYRGTVRLTATDPAAALPPELTFTAVDAGQHTFAPGVTFRTTGTQRLTATDTLTAAVSGLSGPTTVGPGPAAGTPAPVTSAQAVPCAGPPAPSPAQVTPSTVVAGGSVTVTGSGFGPDQDVQVSLVAPSGELTFLKTTRSDAAGAFSVSVEIPSNTAAGTYKIRGSGLGPSAEVHESCGDVIVQAGSTTTSSTTSTSTTSTSTTSTSTTTPTTSTPTSIVATTLSTTTTVATTATTSPCVPTAARSEAQVSPSQVRAGESVTVSGGCFAPNQDLQITLVSSKNVPTSLGTTRSDASGSFTAAVRVPTGVAPDTYRLLVSGPGSAAVGGTREMAAQVTVLAAAAAPLPRTGSSAALLAVAGALGLAGVLMLRYSRRDGEAY